MIYLTGDTHGGLDAKKLNRFHFPQGGSLTKNDYLIILGDFGYIFYNNPDNNKEKYLLDRLNKKPWTTLFLDGNHENFHRLNNDYPIIENWNGGKVHKIKDNILHLMRGQIYNIEGNSFFVMGGAMSLDKGHRIENISWWKEEIPSYAEEDEALANLEKHGNKVDYVLTHMCPQSILHKFVRPFTGVNDPTGVFLDYVNDSVDFKKWYFGHLHDDKDIGKYCLLYNKVVPLEK